MKGGRDGFPDLAGGGGGNLGVESRCQRPSASASNPSMEQTSSRR